MEFKIEKYDEINLMVVHATGHFDAISWSKMLYDDVRPFMEKYQSDPVYLITDYTNLTVDFPEFIQFMKDLKERRATQPVANLQQFLVGGGQWMSNFRNLYLKQFNETLGMFDNVEDAIQYVRDDFEKLQS